MPSEQQSDLEKNCENYSERPLSAKCKNDSKIHGDLDRNQQYKKNRAPESTADVHSSVYGLAASANISTMKILNQAKNGSKQDLSLDFDLGLDHSQLVPETPGSPSPCGTHPAVSSHKINDQNMLATVLYLYS